VAINWLGYARDQRGARLITLGRKVEERLRFRGRSRRTKTVPKRGAKNP
jgi:hypothetical protein